MSGMLRRDEAATFPLQYSSWNWPQLHMMWVPWWSLNYYIRLGCHPNLNDSTNKMLLPNSRTHGRDSINVRSFFCCDWQHYFTMDYIKTRPRKHHSKLIGTAFLKDTEIRIIQTMTEGKVSRVVIKIPILTRTSGIIPTSSISSPKYTVEKIEVQIG